MAGWEHDALFDAEINATVERLRADPEPKASATYQKLADKRLLAIRAKYDRIQPLEVTIQLVLKEPADHLSPESWNLYPTGVHERTFWMAELQGDLKEQTPQALLRDLHRVVRRDEPYFLEPVEGMSQRFPWADRTRSVDEMKREPLPELRSSTVLVDEAGALRRQYYRDPWKPAKDDSEPRTVFSMQPAWGDE